MTAAAEMAGSYEVVFQPVQSKIDTLTVFSIRILSLPFGFLAIW